MPERPSQGPEPEPAKEPVLETPEEISDDYIEQYRSIYAWLAEKYGFDDVIYDEQIEIAHRQGLKTELEMEDFIRERQNLEPRVERQPEQVRPQTQEPAPTPTEAPEAPQGLESEAQPTPEAAAPSQPEGESQSAEEGTPDILEALKQKRTEYLQAKAQRGRILQRGEFKGEKGQAALARIAQEYHDLRLDLIRQKLQKEIQDLQGPAEEIRAQIVSRMLHEYNQENERIEETITAREKARFQKFKEFWRRHPYARMGIGFSLSAVSVGSIFVPGGAAVGAFANVARGVFSGTSTTVGLEGAISRWQERGLVNKFAKLSREQKNQLKTIKDKVERAQKKQELLSQKAQAKLQNYTPDQFAQEIAPELARLRAIQERKSVKLEQVGPYGGVIAALREKERQILTQSIEQATAGGEQGRENLIAQAIDQGLNHYLREMDKSVELAGEKERKSAIKRWAFSLSAGAIVGTLSTVWGFRRMGRIKELREARAATSAAKRYELMSDGGREIKAPAAALSSESLELTAQKGDSVWKMANRALAQKYGDKFTSFSEAKQTYIIDRVKDAIAKDPSKFGLTDVDQLPEGLEIDFNKVAIFNNQDALFGGAGRLGPAEIENILKNNRVLQEFQAQHPNVPLTSENVEQVLQGNADQVLAGQEAPATVSAIRPQPAPRPVEVTPTLKGQPPQTGLAGKGIPSQEIPKPQPTPGKPIPLEEISAEEKLVEAAQKSVETSAQALEKIWDWEPGKFLDAVFKTSENRADLISLRQFTSLLKEQPDLILKPRKIAFADPGLLDRVRDELVLKISILGQDSREKVMFERMLGHLLALKAEQVP